jgi:hypothetical protein
MPQQHGVQKVALSPEELRAFGIAIDQARAIVTASDAFIREVAEPPVAGSAIAQATASGMRDPYDSAELLLFTARDHLRALVIFAEAGQLPVYAPFTLLRATAEATVRARFLLEPGLSNTDRVARHLNERLMNLREQHKVIADKAHLDKRLAELQQRASALGIPPIVNPKNGGIDGFGSRRPYMTDLFGLYLQNGSETYRILSAYAHSMTWLLLRPSRAIKDSSGQNWMPLVTDARELAVFIAEVCETLDEACIRWVEASGQPRAVWDLAKQQKS